MPTYMLTYTPKHTQFKLSLCSPRMLIVVQVQGLQKFVEFFKVMSKLRRARYILIRPYKVKIHDKSYIACPDQASIPFRFFQLKVFSIFEAMSKSRCDGKIQSGPIYI